MISWLILQTGIPKPPWKRGSTDAHAKGIPSAEVVNTVRCKHEHADQCACYTAYDKEFALNESSWMSVTDSASPVDSSARLHLVAQPALGYCWVMQCTLPALSRMSREFLTATTCGYIMISIQHLNNFVEQLISCIRHRASTAQAGFTVIYCT